ncbi:myo-inositol-1(or 4)-monophosphatase [Amaricoccus macauensis]|uniref:Myo-inositol-1(Or 4)-monophosphatase n=1 Tax=Amaricoccus macauensis TaxID=57001 RepID=A0A840SJ83_9RHOB|nr:myo-inositol-1(or 4)-monophosphatase [Amaricoccus macauensis]
MTDASLLTEIVLEAGALALARADAPGAVRDKPGGGGPVSEADIEVDRLMRARLLAARPDYGWLSEETEDGPERLSASRVFVVDPIDGTRAFLAGKPTWAISAAIVEAGEPTVGIVHMPALSKTYIAERGRGATRNGRPIAPSTRRELDGAEILANANQFEPDFWPGGVPAIERQFRPSIAYRLCLVAEGRFDAMLTFRPSWEWDIAAGALIAREAGALVTDEHGAPLAFNRADPRVAGIVTAPPPLHAALLARHLADAAH